MKPLTLYYVHDPMCSWCWAYQPVLKKIQHALSDSIEIIDLLGGLAPDTNQIMPIDMQKKIKSYWQKIESQLGTEFNYCYWEINSPRRSTYPACRAILASGHQGGQQSSRSMTLAIQKAYYLRAMNPSNEDVLLQIADEQGLDMETFKQSFKSESLQQQLLKQIAFARSMGGNSFPSWFLHIADTVHPIVVDYTSADTSLTQIAQLCTTAH